MRIVGLLPFAALLLMPVATFAQSSPPFYVNKDYRFAAIFPGEPVAMDVTYTNSSGDMFPGRQFSVVQDSNRHVITIVDIAAGMPVDLNIVEHAAADLRARGAVRFSADDEYDPGLPGRQLNIFQPNGQQLRASVYMWDHRLYITEATGVPGAQSLLQFEQSITLLDADGSELNLDAARFEGRP